MNGNSVLVDGVSKRFGDFVALNDINFEIKAGEFFSLLGPSGCGKTTLLRIIAGFEQPDCGVISFDGRNVLSLSPDKRPSNTVFQTYALFPHLSVYENIAFPLRLRHFDNATIDKMVREKLALIQLEDHAQKKPSQLSGGQKQRVAIARALINEPKVLLLDEPLSALDAKLRSSLLVELDSLHDKVGITFIYVTHDQSEALSVSDRIAVMNRGNLLQVGTPFEIYEQPATSFVAKFIGETNLFDATVQSCDRFHNEKTDEDEFMVNLQCDQLPKPVQITDYDETKIGQKVAFTVRPEKIRITLDEPKVLRKDVNYFAGIVDEPIYSGFQSKFYVRLENGGLIKVFKQHSNYSDDGPEFEWKDRVFVSWTADDGYIIEDCATV